MKTVSEFLNRWAAFLLALGIVMCFQSRYTIEWSYPYCSSQADGPASAVFGMPLPYMQFSGVSSAEYYFVPLLYVLNVLVLTTLAWPLTRLLLRRLPERRAGIRIGLGLTGLTLALIVSAVLVSLVRVGAWLPRASLGLHGYYTYSDFRPVRFTFNDLHYDCTPSSWWFQNGWTHK
ncbi:MAG: hypothetical protein ABSD59_06470 [Terracidiphilus sp.]